MIGSSPLGGTITAADTLAHAFPAGIRAVLVYFWTPVANNGTVTISDAVGIVANNLVGGIVVPEGLAPFGIGPLLELSSLAYQFSNAGDILNYLVMR